MTDRRRRGASWSSNCFQTSSAFGFLFFMVFLSGRDIGEKEKKKGHDIEDSGQQPEYRAPIWRDQGKCPARRLHRLCGRGSTGTLACAVRSAARSCRGVLQRAPVRKLRRSLKNVFGCHSERSEESAFSLL